MENKIARLVHKHGLFLSLGLTLTLGYMGTQALSFGSNTHIPVVSTAIELGGVGLFLLSAFSAFINILSVKDKSLVGFSALNYMINEKKNIGETIYNHYKKSDVLSSDEVKEKEMFNSFFKTIGLAMLLDVKATSNFKHEVGIITEEQLNNSLLKKAYLEQCVDKNVNILGKLFIYSLTSNEHKEKTKKTKDSEGLSGDIFKNLLLLNHELNESEQKYIKTELKKLKPENITNSFLIEFMQQREHFALLDDENKKLFLHVAGNRLANRDELVEVYNKTAPVNQNQEVNLSEEQSIQSLEQRAVVINELSYQNFSKFKNNFFSIYQNEDKQKIEPILGKIEALLLVKEQLEQMLPFTAEKDLVDLKMFLSQDVDKIVNSFNREITILHKMKIMNHPELKEKKAIILEGINQRVDLVIDKVKDFQNVMHNSLSDELDSEYQVNKKVLSAKM